MGQREKDWGSSEVVDCRGRRTGKARSGRRGCVHQGLESGPRDHLCPHASPNPSPHTCTRRPPQERASIIPPDTRVDSFIAVNKDTASCDLVGGGAPDKAGTGMGSWRLQDCLLIHNPSHRRRDPIRGTALERVRWELTGLFV